MGRISFQTVKRAIGSGAIHWILGFVLTFPAFVHGQDRTFRDAIGRDVKVSYPPTRIVSLAPDITETLFALGLDSEIIGVTRFSNFPPAVKTKTKVGSYVDINIEAVIDLRPDLVLGTAAGNSKIQVEKLEHLGLSVLVVYPRDFDEILETICLIARVVGREETGQNIVRDMKDRTERVRQRVKGRKKPLVLLQIGQDPIFTVSKGSFANDLISMAGGDNIAKDEKVAYPSYSLEEVILKSPEVIISSSMYAKADPSLWLEYWKRWRVLPAVRNNRLHIIDSDLIDRPSPRIIEGLEQMARMIHPEAFKQ